MLLLLFVCLFICFVVVVVDVCDVSCGEKKCFGPLFDGGRSAHVCLVTGVC